MNLNKRKREVFEEAVAAKNDLGPGQPTSWYLGGYWSGLSTSSINDMATSTLEGLPLEVQEACVAAWRMGWRDGRGDKDALDNTESAT